MDESYPINESPASLRCSDPSLVRKMEEASAKIRAKEATITTRMIEQYKSHWEYCIKFRETHGYNPGGWNEVHAIKDQAAALAAKAVQLESSAMIQETWISEGWKSETWGKEIISRLKQEYADIDRYNRTYVQRWEKWKKEGGKPESGLEDKRLEYISHRFTRIEEEIVLTKQLEKFGRQLMRNQYPDPNSKCMEANQYLAAFYKWFLTKS